MLLPVLGSLRLELLRKGIGRQHRFPWSTQGAQLSSELSDLSLQVI